MEYCIKMLIFSKHENPQLFDETWRIIKNQSERQIGAYYFLYLDILGKCPDKIKNKMTEFRNSVIHKGEFPTKEKTNKYGEYIYNYVYDTLREIEKIMGEKYSLSLGRVINYDRQSTYKDMVKNDIPTNAIKYVSMPTYISITRKDEKNCFITYYQIIKIPLRNLQSRFFTY